MKKFTLLYLVLCTTMFAGVDPGDLDQTFGKNGIVETDLTSDYYNKAQSTAIRPNGKILLAGSSFYPDPYMFALAQYNRDGSLDTSFGDGGKVITDFDLAYAQGRRIMPQHDGKIIFIGTASSYTGWLIARFNTDGSIDKSFGDNGIVELDDIPTQEIASAVIIQKDGKIVVGGRENNIAPTFTNFLIIRLNADGSFDQTWGTNGRMIVDFGNEEDLLSHLAIQKDGKIVASGISETGPNPFNIALVRLNIDGSLDTTFGPDKNGKVVTPVFTGLPVSLVIQADGKLIVGSGIPGVSTVDLLLIRYNIDGSIDGSFGESGFVKTDFGTDEGVISITLQPDGKIVVTGFRDEGYSQRMMVARYNLDGSLDTSFGENGIKSLMMVGGDSDEATSVKVQADGNLLSSFIPLTYDSVTYYYNSEFAMFRLLSGVEVSKPAQAIFAKYALDSDRNKQPVC